MATDYRDFINRYNENSIFTKMLAKIKKIKICSLIRSFHWTKSRIFYFSFFISKNDIYYNILISYINLIDNWFFLLISFILPFNLFSIIQIKKYKFSVFNLLVLWYVKSKTNARISERIAASKDANTIWVVIRREGNSSALIENKPKQKEDIERLLKFSVFFTALGGPALLGK